MYIYLILDEFPTLIIKCWTNQNTDNSVIKNFNVDIKIEFKHWLNKTFWVCSVCSVCLVCSVCSDSTVEAMSVLHLFSP